MTISQRIANLDPRYGLQRIMQNYASVHVKTDTGYLDKGFKIAHEEFLNVGVIALGSGGLLVETCCLVVDWMRKAGANFIGIIPYGSKVWWLVQPQKYLSTQTTTGERIEKIVSRIVGVVGTLLGTFLVLLGRGEWVIKLHKDLQIDVHNAPSASLACSEQEEGAPPPPPPRLEVPGEAASEAHPEPSAETEALASAATSSAPSAPRLPPPPKPAAAPVRETRDFKMELIEKAGKERKVFTMKLLKKQPRSSADKAGSLKSQLKAKVPIRTQSKMVEYTGIEGFRVKGEAKLSELVEELGLFFQVEEEELAITTLDSYIRSINYQETPKPGEILDIKYPDKANANFTIKILDVFKGSVDKVLINFLD